MIMRGYLEINQHATNKNHNNEDIIKINQCFQKYMIPVHFRCFLLDINIYKSIVNIWFFPYIILNQSFLIKAYKYK